MEKVVSHWLKAFGGVSWAENSSLFEVSSRGFTIDGVVRSRNSKFLSISGHSSKIMGTV